MNEKIFNASLKFELQQKHIRETMQVRSVSVIAFLQLSHWRRVIQGDIMALRSDLSLLSKVSVAHSRWNL